MSRIYYTKPSITEAEIRYAADAAANGWGEFSPGGYGFAAMVIVEIIDELD